MALTGQNIGVIKVTPDVRLIDIRKGILTGAGGSLLQEVHLVREGIPYNLPFGAPFRRAVDGDVYNVILVPLTDMAYLDYERIQQD